MKTLRYIPRCVLIAGMLLLSLCLAGCHPTPKKARIASDVLVLRAVDGDTLKVRMPDDTTDTVRIVGMDTPEVVDPRKPVECFGPEASKRMHALADGKTVTLTPAAGDDDRDKYGRLLRYVSLGTMDLGAQMIVEGYARSYDVFPHPRMQAYDGIEKAVRKAKIGLWGACTPLPWTHPDTHPIKQG